MKRIALLFALATMLFIVGCGSNQLTRSGAKNILDKIAAQPVNSQFTLTQEEARRLQGNSFPDIKSARACLPDASDIRVAMGQFAMCRGFVPSGVTWQTPGVTVALDKPVAWTLLEVTGMTQGDGPNEMIVEYTWQYDFSQFPTGLQEALKQPPAPGKSLLRRYDDGWRFVKYV
jgi:hypothetical protein